MEKDNKSTMSPNFVHEKSASDFTIQDEQTLELIARYLSQLSPLQQKAIKIAKMHLGSSFNILKSNGFNDWIHFSREA